MTTFMVTLLQDLLTGVIVGIIFLKLIIHILRGNNLKELFGTKVSLKRRDEWTQISVSGPLTFVSYLKLKRLINHALQSENPVVVDLTDSKFVDHSMMAKLQNLNELTNGALPDITGVGYLKPLYNHDLLNDDYR